MQKPDQATQGRPWTPTEDAALRRLSSEASSAERTAALPGRTRLSIYQRARRLGIRIQNLARWTKKEDATLRRLGSKATSAERRAALPGRTSLAIYTRARRLGIETPKPFGWTAKEDATLRHLAGKTSLMSDVMSAALPRRSSAAIRKRAQKLGIQCAILAAWTPEDDAKLRRLGANASPAERSAAIPGRTRGSIYQRVRKLGIRIQSQLGWSAKDDETLRQLAAEATAGDLQAALPGRRRSAITNRARKLGIQIRRMATKRVTTWTDEEDNILQRLAAKASLAELSAALPGRSLAAIYQRMRKVGIPRQKPRPATWTRDEDAALRRLAAKASATELKAALPGRSRMAIYARANRLGIPTISFASVQAPAARWTREEEAALRRAYAMDGLAAAHAALPDRAPAAIDRRAIRLGLGVSKRHVWTPAEETILRRANDSGGLGAAVKALPHISENAINKKRQSLGLKTRSGRRTGHRWSAEETKVVEIHYPVHGSQGVKKILPHLRTNQISGKALVMGLTRQRK